MKLPFLNKIQLQPVQIDDEDDELIRAILDDSREHDNVWQLEKFSDVEESSEFWKNIDLNQDDGEVER